VTDINSSRYYFTQAENMNKRISIFLQNSCKYTQEGIKCLLNESYCDVEYNITTQPLGVGAHNTLRNNDVNIFIVGLQGYSDSHFGILEFIMKWLPVVCPEARVVIMANTHSIGTLKNYLLGLTNVYAVLDHAVTLQDFRMHLQSVIIGSQSIAPRKPTATQLTHQELNVLKYLLKGMPIFKVADAMRINYKTVSSHKRSALNKLGINSLHGLMKCGNSTHMMNELLITKI
jgi:DNA-binding NarL/FixJ family response regulator